MPLPLRRLAPLLFGATLLAGCVSLRPYEEVRRELPAEDLLTLDGRTVHVRSRGAGEPLVLLHGFGGSALTWARVEPELARGYRTVAIDLNGFGWTERPGDPESYSLEGQERLVLSVLDALGLERAHFAGHSYGGGLAIFLASRHPERVRSLLLVDSTLPAYSSLRRSPIFAPRWLARLFTRTVALRASNVRRGLRASYADDTRVDDALVGSYLERLSVEGAGDAFWGLTRPRPGGAYSVDLATIRAPALFVWGEEDELIPVEEGRSHAALLPDAAFAALPGCGHSPMEECPEAFLAAALPFLAAR